MLIGGIQKLSLVDYPGQACISLFTIGCNMRCGFCHNAELVVPACYAQPLDESEVLAFLDSRRHLIKAVTISGGEPTLQPDLAEFIAKVKAMGYLVKLDSNGTNPEILQDLIDRNLLDFIAMDVKSPLANYSLVAGAPINTAKITASIALIKNSGIAYEFRTTIVDNLHQLADIEAIGQLIGQGSKAQRFALQHFRNGKCIDDNFLQAGTFSESQFAAAKQIMERYAEQVVIH